MKSTFLLAFLFSALISSAQKEAYLLVGTYTSGKSDGIYVYKFNTGNADNTFVSSIKTSNPSFLAISPDKNFVYAVNEDADTDIFPGTGAVTSFSFDKGILTKINSRSSGGKHPCYITTDASGKWLFAGNYSSGNAALFPLNADGSIGSLKQLIQHNGSGSDTGRQKIAHVHATVLSRDQRYLFVPDLGMDKLMVYEFNNRKGTLQAAKTPFALSKPGSGPRHFDIAGNNKYAYLMEELSGTIVVYEWRNEQWRSRQRLSALPADFKGIISSADIHVSTNGNYLYCSNRGESNTIGIFKINKKNGMLTLAGHQSTMGMTPRNFNFDPSGNFLLVANQQSDEIVIFKIDKQTGLLTDTNKSINIPSPVCIKWIQ